MLAEAAYLESENADFALGAYVVCFNFIKNKQDSIDYKEMSALIGRMGTALNKVLLGEPGSIHAERANVAYGAYPIPELIGILHRKRQKNEASQNEASQNEAS